MKVEAKKNASEAVGAGAGAGAKVGLQKMVTRQTTRQATASGKDNTSQESIIHKKAWTIQLSDLGTSSVKSKSSKGSNQRTVKPKAVKKRTVVVAKKTQKMTVAVVKKKVKLPKEKQLPIKAKKQTAVVTTKTEEKTKTKGKVAKVVKVAKKTVKAKTEDKLVKPIDKVVKVKLTAVALKKHEMRNDDLVTIRPPNRGDSWDGNSEADGSVNSGVLDENLCFTCGEATTEADADRTVLCDICGGEYHFSCVGLDMLPRLAFKCQDCLQEIEWNDKKDFQLHNTLNFPPPPKRRRHQIAEVCYSPSRPLEQAWQECLVKGFMLVKKVFPVAVIDKLTHGGVQRLTKYGRVAENWTGAVDVLSSQINMTTHNVINRDGRFDIKIPQFVVAELQLETLLQPILSRLTSIMSPHRTPLLRTHNIICAPVGSDSQTWHVDDSMTQGKYHSYFTILIHLNSIDDLCGGTEIWSKVMKRGDMIRGRPGDAFVFNGSLLHRGQGNRGFTHRWFYYASFSCSQDANEYRL